MEEDDYDDALSSSPSIHENEIDFQYVYALRTFTATEQGQASATKGDAMVLLNDSNSYWWLVRVVKDASVGFLPAEHVETPTERLARLNKHRNESLCAQQSTPASSLSASSGLNPTTPTSAQALSPLARMFGRSKTPTTPTTPTGKTSARNVKFNDEITCVSASEYEYSDEEEDGEDDDDHSDEEDLVEHEGDDASGHDNGGTKPDLLQREPPEGQVQVQVHEAVQAGHLHISNNDQKILINGPDIFDSEDDPGFDHNDSEDEELDQLHHRHHHQDPNKQAYDPINTKILPLRLSTTTNTSSHARNTSATTTTTDTATGSPTDSVITSNIPAANTITHHHHRLSDDDYPIDTSEIGYGDPDHIPIKLEANARNSILVTSWRQDKDSPTIGLPITNTVSTPTTTNANREGPKHPENLQTHSNNNNNSNKMPRPTSVVTPSTFSGSPTGPIIPASRSVPTTPTSTSAPTTPTSANAPIKKSYEVGRQAKGFKSFMKKVGLVGNNGIGGEDLGAMLADDVPEELIQPSSPSSSTNDRLSQPNQVLQQHQQASYGRQSIISTDSDFDMLNPPSVNQKRRSLVSAKSSVEQLRMEGHIHGQPSWRPRNEQQPNRESVYREDDESQYSLRASAVDPIRPLNVHKPVARYNRGPNNNASPSSPSSVSSRRPSSTRDRNSVIDNLTLNLDNSRYPAGMRTSLVGRVDSPPVGLAGRRKSLYQLGSTKPLFAEGGQRPYSVSSPDLAAAAEVEQIFSEARKQRDTMLMIDEDDGYDEYHHEQQEQQHDDGASYQGNNGEHHGNNGYFDYPADHRTTNGRGPTTHEITHSSPRAQPLYHEVSVKQPQSAIVEGYITDDQLSIPNSTFHKIGGGGSVSSSDTLAPESLTYDDESPISEELITPMSATPNSVINTNTKGAGGPIMVLTRHDTNDSDNSMTTKTQYITVPSASTPIKAGLSSPLAPLSRKAYEYEPHKHERHYEQKHQLNLGQLHPDIVPLFKDSSDKLGRLCSRLDALLSNAMK